MVGDSNDETNFPHKLLSTNKKIWHLKLFQMVSANIKFSKMQLSNMLQSAGSLFQLIVNFPKVFPKNVILGRKK